MNRSNAKYSDVDSYIKAQPESTQDKLRSMRQIVKELAPDAVESISYGMPAYKLNGKPLAYFAAFTEHIGFYPIPSGVEAFKEEFSGYKTTKGGIQLPLDKPLPVDLIKKVIKYRVAENASASKGYGSNQP